MADSLLHFIETSAFRKRLDKLADLSLLFEIQADLLENPKLGAVISGTNGARKARSADKRHNRGKRGSFRYIYLYLEHVGTIYLLLIYPKNERDTLTPNEIKELGNLVLAIKKLYGE